MRRSNAPRWRRPRGSRSSPVSSAMRRVFHELHDTLPWQQTEVLRYDHYVPERRLGVGVSTDATPMLRQTGPPSAVALSRSVHGCRGDPLPQRRGLPGSAQRSRDALARRHADRDRRARHAATVRLAPSRGRWRTGRARPGGNRSDDVVLTPGEGDMLVMGGGVSTRMVARRAQGVDPEPRISLTWRWTSRRGRPDTNPTFYDGRQFSDRPRQPGSRTLRP